VPRFINTLSSVLLGSPLLWGGALTFCFYALVHGGVISHPQVLRYLAGHWVEYVEVALFAVGLAALGMKAHEVLRQRGQPDEDFLEPIPEGGQPIDDAIDLAAALPERVANRGVMPRRLRTALDYVIRTGSAETLDDHLKYLADVDAARAAQGYGLVRFVVWAIPIMGFLGTVIGITVAIANLSPTQMENISDVVAGLGTAFDTTATALALSMVLMFLQFVIDRSEQRLLARVDDAVWLSLGGRFQVEEDSATSLAITRLGETVSRGSARLLDAQEQAWRSLERTAADGIRQLLDQTGDRLQTTLTASLESVLGRWSESLVRSHDAVVAQREQRWTQAAESLATAVGSLERHQEMIAGQTELLGDVVDATRDIRALERSLDANLGALATSGRFEETLSMLAAAVQMLASRAGDTADRRRLDPGSLCSSGKAA
jgi:hypothetical protein